MHKILRKTVLTLTTLALLASSALAQPLTPLQVEYSSFPGEVIKGQVSVLNTADKARTINVNTSNFQPESKVDSLQNWIIIPQNSFLVKAGEKVVIPYEIHVPINAPSQGYYGAIEVQTSATNSKETAHLVLLEVEGNTYQDIILQDLSIDNETLDIVIRNNGNIHSSPEGLVEIIDSRGNIVEEFQLNKDNQNILPQNTKTYFEDSYTKNLPAGIYYAVIDGKAENGQQIQGKLTFQIDRTGKIEIIDKYIGAVDEASLRGAAQRQYVIFQTVLAVLAVFIFAIAFLAIGRYCVVSSKAFKKRKR